MYRVKSGNWVWRWRSPGDWEKLGPHPEQKTADAEIVKINPVRSVFRRNGYFLKLENPDTGNPAAFARAVLFPQARREFHSAAALEHAEVPVICPAGYGQAMTSSMLVTRETSGAVAVNSWYQKRFVRGGADPSGFLHLWAGFMKKLLMSGFYHPDFHGGNLLYLPEKRNFVLVDVYGVRRRRFFQTAGRRRMIMAAREFREILNREQLVELLRSCGASDCCREDAEKMHAGMLRYAAGRTRREMPRRLRQFFSNYAKYVKAENIGERRLWMTLDAAGDPLAEPGELDSGRYETISGESETLQQLRRMDFELSLHLVPHPKIVAWDETYHRIYRERTGRPVNEHCGGYLRERLSAAGFNPDEFLTVGDRFGRPAVAVKEIR